MEMEKRGNRPTNLQVPRAQFILFIKQQTD